MTTLSCLLCQNKKISPVYAQDNMPIFQNKVYDTVSIAEQALISNMVLSLCHACGFVFNSAFNTVNMNYDSHYENEQAHSPSFQSHLLGITELLKNKNYHNKKIVEIGCGKGTFLEYLSAAEFNITGFDPAYTGKNSKVIKDYFSEKYADISADLIVLRHVLEHIQNPLEFLHTIGRSVNYNAYIYIEVPSLEWILDNNAFWDIFYEHCNYFSLDSLGSLFTQAEKGLLFNGQYMYVLADLRNLKQKGTVTSTPLVINRFQGFQNTIDAYQKKLIALSDIAIWGSAAKGVTFANLLDKNKRLISYMIDINPKKQNKYIAKSAHKIISPDTIKATSIKNILVMNNNYFDEIHNLVSHLPINLFKLEDLASHEVIHI